MTTLISWLCLGYFGILLFERLYSLSTILATGNGIKGFFTDGFNSYVNVICILSIVATLILLGTCNKDFWKSLFNNSIVPDYSMLAITAGVMLVSGMVHTEGTIAPVQFGSYGVLILAMVLRTVQNNATSDNKFDLWYSLAFLTVFSMAIPVVYHSDIKNHVLFHIIEAITSLALVFFFTYLLRFVFVGGPQADNLLLWIPIIVMAIGDALIIAMRWKEEINWFVLIFASLSAVLFAVGKVLFPLFARK